jgi:precorrin-6x reductase
MDQNETGLARRKKVPVVMLTRIDKTAWTTHETSLLVDNLKPIAVIAEHHEHKKVLLIIGGLWQKDEIAGVVGHNKFEHEIVVGMDNTKLPFRPWA